MLEITDAIDQAIADLRAAVPDRTLWSGHSAAACEESVHALISDLTRWREQLVGIDWSRLVVHL